MGSGGPETGSAPSILIVDDADDIRDALQVLLGSEGYSVSAARNGREALGCLETIPRPKVIILDLMMPVMDGAGFITELARLPDVASIPVIIISAGLDLEPQTLPPVLGGFFTKPFDIEKLLRAVRFCVEGGLRKD